MASCKLPLESRAASARTSLYASLSVPSNGADIRLDVAATRLRVVSITRRRYLQIHLLRVEIRRVHLHDSSVVAGQLDCGKSGKICKLIR